MSKQLPEAHPSGGKSAPSVFRHAHQSVPSSNAGSCEMLKTIQQGINGLSNSISSDLTLPFKTKTATQDIDEKAITQEIRSESYSDQRSESINSQCSTSLEERSEVLVSNHIEKDFIKERRDRPEIPCHDNHCLKKRRCTVRDDLSTSVEYRIVELSALKVKGFHLDHTEFQMIHDRIQSCVRLYFAPEKVFKDKIRIKHKHGTSLVPSNSILFCHSKERFDLVCETATIINRIELKSNQESIEPTFELYEKRFTCKLVDDRMVFGRPYKVLILNSDEARDVVLMSTDDVLSLAVEYLAFFSSVSKVSETTFMNTFMKWINANRLQSITQFGLSWTSGSRKVSVNDRQFEKGGPRPLELVCSSNDMEDNTSDENTLLFRQHSRRSNRVPAVARVFRQAYFSFVPLADELRNVLGL